MKIALITDTHFGGRSDNPDFAKWQKKFYDTVFWPEIDSRGITEIMHLGDAFDHRKYINFCVLSMATECFIEPLADRKINFSIIAGNHDCYYRSNNTVSSVRLLFPDTCNIVDEYPIEIGNIGMIPWVCRDNSTKVAEFLKTTTSEIILCHMDMGGFVMQPGIVAHHDSVPPSLLKRFPMVVSGHYHHRSTQRNITYMGNPYHMFWNDIDDVRGFAILDTGTKQLEYVNNPHSAFTSIDYTEGMKAPNVTDKFVRLTVNIKQSESAYADFINEIRNMNPIDLQIKDNSMFVQEEINVSFDDNIEDLITNVNDDPKIQSLFKDLYKEAQTME